MLCALTEKVSRERVGTEVEGMLKGANSLTAMQHAGFSILVLGNDDCVLLGNPLNNLTE